MGALDWASTMFQGGLEQAGAGLINTFLGGIGERRRARINYEYGEKAAQNAFKRQMQLYQISKQDNSPEARRQQLEDAGMSVGLMYGGGGMAGGGAGSTTGAQMGTSGTSAGVDGYANPYAFSAQKQQMELQKAEVETAKATAEKAKAEAKEAESRTTGQNLENDFNEAVMPFRKIIAQSNAMQSFDKYVETRERNREGYEDDTPELRMYTDEFGAGFKIVAGSSLNSQEMRLRYNMLGEQYDLLKNQKEHEWILKNISFEDYVHYEKRFAIAVKEGDAKMMTAVAQEWMAHWAGQNAETNRINATNETNRVNAYITDIEHKYGIKLTPWQVGEKIVDLLMQGVGLYITKGAGKAKAMKTTQEAKEIIRENYDSDGTYRGGSITKTTQSSSQW